MPYYWPWKNWANETLTMFIIYICISVIILKIVKVSLKFVFAKYPTLI